MHLRCALSQLQLGLRHGDALRNREDVGVRDRQHIDAVIEVRLLDGAALAGDIVRILVGQVLGKALGEQLKLQLLAVVQPLVDGRHDRAALLEQSDRRSHSSVLIAVANLHVRDAGHALTSLHTESKQRHERLARLFVRQRQQG